MTSDLLESYRNARYELHLPSGTVLLVVDRHCPQLGEWLAAGGYRGAAWLTAWNPQGKQQAESRNLAAQRQLERQLSGSGYAITHGTAMDPTGGWPSEPSILIPGLPLVEAVELAREFDQLAFLWCGEDAVPRLVQTAQAAR